tara:strand:- start:49 stop:654 length:606 start_codon:yes stop_codon:yes gene_type:complete
MILAHNYFYFKKAIPLKTCKKILKAGHQRIMRRSMVDSGVSGKYIDVTTRNCKLTWINDKWIYDIINPFIHAANKQAGWNFKWDWNENAQFTIYEKGHYYGWHVDQQAIPPKHKNKNINGKIRKLSLTLQLTDKSQYTGGDFQFKWIKEDKKDLLNTITIDDAKDIGTIIIFPSFMWHRVLPITEGKRESLVNWSLGPLFK